LTSRGRKVVVGCGGSAALPVFLATVTSAKSEPAGSVMLRFLACRSTNCLATISSIELDALFTSMPVSCLSRVMAS